MGVLNLCMKENPFSRMFHLSLLVPCLALLILASVSLGTFVPLHLNIRDHADALSMGSGGGQVNPCILFAFENRVDDEVEYRDDTTCDFMIWGQLAVGSLAVAVGGVLIAKAFVGTKVFSPFAFLELIFLPIGFIFTMALGIVITIGIDDTCKAYNAVHGREQFTPCEEYAFEGNLDLRFYDTLNISRVVTWIEAGILFVFMLWYIFVNMVICFTWIKTHGKGKVTKS